ncbi:DNA mismatch repair protein Msh6 [Thelohanellus kitauei]|uniref:DNA mismatch repair protein Msh6 n=1 Tax=Thelohanellus kitauei TaxID=669202 RepID=A0A0C2JFI9_THEKT|nr:DNA mismatch repair protein Msh6 [Thelohanellus kitauei]
MTERNILSFFSPKSQRVLAKTSEHEKQNVPKEKSLLQSKIKKRKFDKENADGTKPKIAKKQSDIQETESVSANTSFNFDEYRLNTSKKVMNQDQSTSKVTIDEIGSTNYPHHSYPFLHESRRDQMGRLPSDPDFDQSTLKLPTTFLSSKDITPAMKQWWKIKAGNFDAVIFFKMGKFYELFHMDADIGVRELGLTYMKGKYAHAGFPETSYAVHASALVEKGYKVCRVEQTERPSDVSTRIKETGVAGVGDKLVKRDLCNIMSPATRLFDAFDINSDSCQNSLNSRLLLSICEDTKGPKNATRLGVCVVNCSIASFTLADLIDDRAFSKMRTMLAHFSVPVAEVVISRGSVTTETLNRLKKCIGSAKVEILSRPVVSENIVKELQSYFPGSEMPAELLELNSENNRENSELILGALSSVLCLLKRHLIDSQIVSSASFTRYRPISLEKHVTQKYMIIDDNTMRNLDVTMNSEGYLGKYGTILSLVDHCMTASGKRKIVTVVCHPLFQKKEIDDRLDAIGDLLALDNNDMNNFREKLGEIPDLERILFRLNSCKQLHENAQHPQNSAVLFNEKFFNKSKVDDVINIINGFEKSFELYSHLQNLNFGSDLLQKILHSNEGVSQDRIREIINFFKEFKLSFDLVLAKTQSMIIPHKGYIKEYDDSLEKIEEIENKLDKYLEKVKKQLGCSNLKYWGSDRSRYQIEIPVSAISEIPDDFELKSQRKGFKRYSVPFCQELLSQLVEAEDLKNSVLKNVFVLLISRLIKHKQDLLRFLDKIAFIDCLFSFAFFSSGSVTSGMLTRPNISDGPKQFINIKQGYHPCLSAIKAVVSNDIALGVENETTLLITGPNMGGKSTIMRQTAVIIILAQLGCYVPCDMCELTPFDRIFARLGASFDHPNSGESTFYVELSETSLIINGATEKSFVLLDELGRGTATHDGLAIAYSVLKYITSQIRCLTMFSTHYHYIARDLQTTRHMNIRMMYMQCLVEEESEDCENENGITFLYKIKEGVCPKSYGFYVARLAGMDKKIISRGIEMARKMERNSLLNELIQAKRSNQVIDYLSLCKKIAKL